MEDGEYIKDLEGLVLFLAKNYEATKEMYFDSHLKTCSVSNPNRRDLTDDEQREWQRFPLIQGSRLQSIISQIAKTNKPMPKNITETVNRFTSFTDHDN